MSGKATVGYRAADIEVLEGLEPVRKRPGMYIGGTEGPHGLHHLAKEIIDNSVDEAMNGHASEIKLILHLDRQSLTVSDNGRGIPVDNHPIHKRSALELILTTLHAGGKFSEKNYHTAGGLHGVGASVVNALSSEFKVRVEREGGVYVQEFSRGKPKAAVKKTGASSKHGTTIFFRPDTEIFRVTTFSEDLLRKILEEKAFLNRGLKMVLVVEEPGGESREIPFYFADGIASYLRNYLERNTLEAVGGECFSLERNEEVRVEIALCWTEDTKEVVLSYVNGIHTPSGGTHEDGFRNGLVRAVRNYITTHDLAPKGVKLASEDIREGLVAVLAVNIPGSVAQLQFQGQTKDKLNTVEATLPVENLLRSFENTLNNKPSLGQALAERMFLAAKARAAARAASQGVSRKLGVSHRLNLPGKLADCSATQPQTSEVFIVEGDSAGGSAKQGRDRKTQAVLPLRGKVLNSVGLSEDKVMANRELTDLVSALGCGVGKALKLEKLRYGKVIILTDADADGMHIAALLMAFFFKCMRPLIEGGHLFLGLSPLFRVRIGSGSTAKDHWVFTEEERDKLVAASKGRSLHITRFKGLGEMNPETLWRTTLDPANRNLLRISIEDGEEATAMFQRLLGKDAVERYRLIQDNAHRLEVDL